MINTNQNSACTLAKNTHTKCTFCCTIAHTKKHCIDTQAWALLISLETSNCLGLCDVLLGQLALLGFILLLEVYSVDLCFLSLLTLENKEMFPPPTKTSDTTPHYLSLIHI